MSTVRTLALGALMLVGVAGVSAAQSTATPRTRADAGSDRRGGRGGREGFGRDLNLTDAQKAQIKAIRQKYQPQNEALRTQAKPFMDAARAARQSGDSVAFRTNMEKARQLMVAAPFKAQERAEIRAVLTAEQQAKFDAHEKDRAQGGQKGWGRKGHGAPPAAKK